MGCLLALLAGFAPRIALVLVWIFSNLRSVPCWLRCWG